MNKALTLAALASMLFALPAFAHHAAVDIVDEETYEMIDDNLEAVDSPHLDLTLDDLMG